MTTTDAGVRWLTAAQQRSWRQFLEGTARLNEALSRDLEATADVSLSEYEVLVRLSEAPEWTLRMSRLAEGLAHSRSRVTHTVRRMQERGLVRRESCTGDGRGVNCVMTETGHALLVAAAPSHVASVRRYIVDVLSKEELTVLGRSMATIANACKD